MIGTQRQLSYETPQLRVVARIDGQTPIAKLAKVPDLFFWIFVIEVEKFQCFTAVRLFYDEYPSQRHNIFVSIFVHY
jgi:hypothetical protein